MDGVPLLIISPNVGKYEPAEARRVSMSCVFLSELKRKTVAPGQVSHTVHLATTHEVCVLLNKECSFVVLSQQCPVK